MGSINRIFSLLILAFLVFQGCSSDDEPPPDPIPEIEEELSAIHQYFMEIAFGNEFVGGYDNIRKWNTDITVFLPIDNYEYLNDELDQILAELNPLLTNIKVTRVFDREEANYLIYFGDKDTYVSEYEPNASGLVENNWGLLYIYWNNWAIDRGSMYVDIIRTVDIDCQKHLLREELTQSLGLMDDSYRYPESIFYQDWTCGPKYIEVDKQLIKLLYDPNITSGMTKQAVISYLRSLEGSS